MVAEIINKSIRHNIVLAIWRAKCFVETFVDKQTFILRMNISAKNPPHRQYVARYVTLINKTA